MAESSICAKADEPSARAMKLREKKPWLFFILVKMKLLNRLAQT